MAELLSQRDKIKTLMRRDPAFIGRLISVRCAAARRQWWRRFLLHAACMLPCCLLPPYRHTYTQTCTPTPRLPPPPPNNKTTHDQQLDRHMHKMLWEKRERSEAVRADEAAIARLDATIASHVAPHLARLEAAAAEKAERRDAMRAQLERQVGETAGLGKEVAALVGRARHASGRLLAQTARDRLQEARGFSATVPTTTLVRGGGGGKKAAAAASVAAGRGGGSGSGSGGGRR